MAGLIGFDSTSSGFDPGLQVPPITFGVWGDSGEADGVIGSSNTGVGVFGRSVGAGAPAVRGASENGTGVQAASTGGTALHARRDPGGGAAVTEAFLATPSLAADFRGDVAATGELRVSGSLGAGSLNIDPNGPGGILVGDPNTGSGGNTSLLLEISDGKAGFARIQAIKSSGSAWGDIALNPLGGNVGIGTTAPTHPIHVANARGIRLNDLYLSGARVPSVSYNAHLNEAANSWVFPDPSRPAVTVQMYDNGGNPEFDVYSTTRENPTAWVLRLRIDGQSGAVDIPNGGLNVTNRSGYGIRASGSAAGMEVQGPVGMVASSTSGGYAGLFSGDVRVTGRLQKATSNFEIDHPLDPANKFLCHSAIECDEMKNIYDGIADLDADGRAEVVLPDWFEALNENFRYQLTPVGAAAPDLHIADELRDGRFAIAGGQPDTKVCWQVSGVRHDAYAQAHPLQVEARKAPEEAGLFLHAEEHNQPAERSMVKLFTAPANGSGQR
jgi:hypothetical protein